VARLQYHRNFVLSTVPEVELDDLRFDGDHDESYLSDMTREIYKIVNHLEKVSSQVSCFSLEVG
jgi:hypothetical protein